MPDGVLCGDSNFWVCGQNSMMWPFKWSLSSCTYTWCYLFFQISQNEIWTFGWQREGKDKAKKLKIPYTSQIAQRRTPFDSNGPSWHLLALSFFKDPKTLLGTGRVHVKEFYARDMKNNDTKSQSAVMMWNIIVFFVALFKNISTWYFPIKKRSFFSYDTMIPNLPSKLANQEAQWLPFQIVWSCKQ